MRCTKFIKKILFSALIFFMLGATSASATVLNVPQKYTEIANCCWSGCSQAILEYYGTIVTQTEIVAYGTEGYSTGNILCGEEYVPSLGIWRKGIDLILYYFGVISSTCYDGYYFTRDGIRGEIDAGRPIQIRIYFWTEGGHAQVITGFDGNNVYLMDPTFGPLIGTYEYVVSNELSIWAGTLKLDSNASSPEVGGGGGDNGGGGCFIATAAFGSPIEPHVCILRDFRDRYLLTNLPGNAFVQLYYKYSPRFAHFIAKHDNVRHIVRWSLLPLVGVSWAVLRLGPVITLLLTFLFISGLISLVVTSMQKFKKLNNC